MQELDNERREHDCLRGLQTPVAVAWPQDIPGSLRRNVAEYIRNLKLRHLSATHRRRIVCS